MDTEKESAFCRVNPYREKVGTVILNCELNLKKNILKIIKMMIESLTKKIYIYIHR